MDSLHLWLWRAVCCAGPQHGSHHREAASGHRAAAVQRTLGSHVHPRGKQTRTGAARKQHASSRCCTFPGVARNVSRPHSAHCRGHKEPWAGCSHHGVRLHHARVRLLRINHQKPVCRAVYVGRHWLLLPGHAGAVDNVLKRSGWQLVHALQNSTCAGTQRDLLFMDLLYRQPNTVPATWALAKYGLVSFSVEQQLYGYADILAKVVLTLILVNATVEQTHSQRIDALSGIATEMQAELGNTDKLLERMMPAEVLEQLKNGTAPSAKEYESVTGTYSLTQSSSRTSPTSPFSPRKLQPQTCSRPSTTSGRSTTQSQRNGASTRSKQSATPTSVSSDVQPQPTTTQHVHSTLQSTLSKWSPNSAPPPTPQ